MHSERIQGRQRAVRTHWHVGDDHTNRRMNHVDTNLLSSVRYVELTPPQADVVDDPAHRSRASYYGNGLGKANDRIAPHALCRALGATPMSRLRAQRALFRG